MVKKQKYLVNITLDDITLLKNILVMYKEIEKCDINLIFKKSPEMENKTNSNDTINDMTNEDSASSDQNADSKITGGITIKFMDSFKTICSIAKIKASIFTEYYINEEILSCWINLEQFINAITISDTDDCRLSLTILEKDKNKLNIFVTSESEGDSKISLILLDETTIIDPIKINYDYLITIDTKAFMKLFKKVKRFSDTVTLKCTGTKLICEWTTTSNGCGVQTITDTTQNYNMTIRKNKYKEDDDIISSYFDITDFLKIKNAHNIASNVVIGFGKNLPLFINFKLYTQDETQDATQIGAMYICVASKNDDNYDGYLEKTKDNYDDEKPKLKT